MSRREDKTFGEAPVHPPTKPSICCLFSLPPPSPRRPRTQQYQVGGEAQVDCSQQCHKAEVGRVG